MNKNYAVHVIEKNCKQCGICVAFCPKQVLKQQMGHTPEVVRIEACIGCRMCQLRCPDFAIEMEVMEQ